MAAFTFFPFINAINSGKVILPDINTVMKKIGTDEVIPSNAGGKTDGAEIVNIIDFEKIENSRGRQNNDSDGYSHEELRDIGKRLKSSGYDISTGSKNTIIDSILRLR
jgi:hypothetical protein